MNENNKPKPTALTEWTYQNLKDDILNFVIKPGEQLNMEDIARNLEVSRTPIREAFLKLASEGLVEIRPRVGYFVVNIRKEDLINLFEIREIIETHAAKTAATQLTDEDIDQLGVLIEEGKKAVEKKDLSKYLEIDIKFHGFLQKHIKNLRLIAFMDSLNDQIHRGRVLSIRSEENIQATLEEHQLIYQALCHRDEELSGLRMAAHLQAVCRRLVDYLDENKHELDLQQNLIQ